MRIVLMIALLASPQVWADNQHAQATANGGTGGNATGIGHGGLGGTASGFGGAGGIGGAGGLGGLGGIGQGGEGHGGLGGAGGVGQGGTATNDGNSQGVSIDQPRQSPSVFMGAPAPTAPCQASMGGFLSFIGGIGLAGSRTLEECEVRESSRIAHAIGQPDMAKEIICMGKYASKTRACRDQ
jgi:hypothetical protein